MSQRFNPVIVLLAVFILYNCQRQNSNTVLILKTEIRFFQLTGENSYSIQPVEKREEMDH